MKFVHCVKGYVFYFYLIIEVVTLCILPKVAIAQTSLTPTDQSASKTSLEQINCSAQLEGLDDSEAVDHYRDQALVYFHQGHVEQAKKCMTQAMTRYPDAWRKILREQERNPITIEEQKVFYQKNWRRYEQTGNIIHLERVRKKFERATYNIKDPEQKKQAEYCLQDVKTVIQKRRNSPHPTCLKKL